jgi:transcriptional regulator with XRE-family HTH domain
MARSEGSRALAAILKPRIAPGELAERLGVSKQSVSDWLRGDSLPRPELMAKIEDITGVPMRSWTVDAQGDDAEDGKSTEAP